MKNYEFIEYYFSEILNFSKSTYSKILQRVQDFLEGPIYYCTDIGSSNGTWQSFLKENNPKENRSKEITMERSLKFNNPQNPRQWEHVAINWLFYAENGYLKERYLCHLM